MQCNKDTCTLTENLRKLYSLYILIEHIESLKNRKYVGQLSFSEGLVKWNFCGSKAAHTLESCSSACGSITTLKTFFKDKAVNKNVSNLTEDIMKYLKITPKRKAEKHE